MDSNEAEELAKLKTENARLIKLLEAHGVDWRSPCDARDSMGSDQVRQLNSFEISRHTPGYSPLDRKFGQVFGAQAPQASSNITDLASL